MTARERAVLRDRIARARFAIDRSNAKGRNPNYALPPTPRQLQVLTRWAVDGLTQAQVAAELGVAPQTVKTLCVIGTRRLLASSTITCRRAKRQAIADAIQNLQVAA